MERTELKARWVCLDTVGGKLLYSPEKKPSCVLHNIATNEGFPLPEPAQADQKVWCQKTPMDRPIKVPS